MAPAPFPAQGVFYGARAQGQGLILNPGFANPRMPSPGPGPGPRHAPGTGAGPGALDLHCRLTADRRRVFPSQ